MRNRYRSGFEASVARKLRQAGLKVTVRPKIAGLQPDFIVNTADGGRVIFETKQWSPNAAGVQRAALQAKLYTKATKVDRTFFVLKDLKHSAPHRGVLGISDLPKVIGEGRTPRLLITQTRHAKRLALRTTRRRVNTKGQRRSQTVFAAMPFAAAYDDVYIYPMARAAKAAGLTCVRVDREPFEGDIVKEIKRLIRASVAVIADLSEARPDVLYEVGFAHAAGRQVIPISRTSLKKLPFDVRNWNTILYKAGQTHKLTPILSRRLKEAIRKRSA